ncbi:hypothetical protein CC77DRAFT_445544 [Alternaria alternata]|uniref:AA1-like domain-containing protein n=1 Tax=Alternaria alternata TaxID=5599 RepID=A0A177D862_ALTAL|nr:hypothetical protein CC77DRAFT_445544 [Alternaria alternata]OAG15487.1 hypothetical protein CC77DRAFT_445544 [Alternaria alternata]
MKFAIATLFAGVAAAAPTASPDVHGDPYETVTISNFSYAFPYKGNPQMNFYIHSQRVDNVHCAAVNFEVGGVYSCDDPSYTFRVLEETGHKLRLAHVLNGPSMVGDFFIRMYGPIPTALSQTGTSTADLDKEGTA